MLLDDFGILAAVRFLAEGVSQRSQIGITVDGATQGRFEPWIETVLYRTIQEALTNVTKHAAARNVGINLQQEDKMIHCTVKDDGVGFDVEAVLAKRGDRGLGLIGIQERLAPLGGVLRITSAPRQGTELSISVPFEH